MHRLARLRILLLALMVAVSHVALLSHAAGHFHPSLEQCELCVSQAHPLAAVPVAEVVLPVTAQRCASSRRADPVLPPSPPSHYCRSRAPPATSS